MDVKIPVKVSSVKMHVKVCIPYGVTKERCVHNERRAEWVVTHRGNTHYSHLEDTGVGMLPQNK
jgi:hypothetical protein